MVMTQEQYKEYLSKAKEQYEKEDFNKYIQVMQVIMTGHAKQDMDYIDIAIKEFGFIV